MTYDCQLPYSVKPQDAALHAISRLKLSNSNIPSLSVSRNPSTNQGWGEPLRLLRPWPKKYLDSNVIDSTCFFLGGGGGGGGGYCQISTKFKCIFNSHGLTTILFFPRPFLSVILTTKATVNSCSPCTVTMDFSSEPKIKLPS